MKHPDRITATDRPAAFRVDDAILHTALLLTLPLIDGWTAKLKQRTR